MYTGIVGPTPEKLSTVGDSVADIADCCWARRNSKYEIKFSKSYIYTQESDVLFLAVLREKECASFDPRVPRGCSAEPLLFFAINSFNSGNAVTHLYTFL